MNQRELYILVPIKSKPFIEDSLAMEELNRINLENPVNGVLLVSERNCPLVRRYCSDRRPSISLQQCISLSTMVEDIMEGKARNYNRIVAVTDKKIHDLQQRKEYLDSIGVLTSLRVIG